jgi:hypothetical protein
MPINMVDNQEETMTMTPRTANRRSWLVLVACLALAACSGCARPEVVYPVQGQVFLDGKPAARAQVVFHPVGAGPDAAHPVGQTDDEGRFTLTTRETGDGAPAGEYRVAVARFLALQGRGAAEGESVTVNDLPARYGAAESSGLTATVRPGENRLPPFALKRK